MEPFMLDFMVGASPKHLRHFRFLNARENLIFEALDRHQVAETDAP
jgi:hypothetical protein